jgi:hypothetical protein
MTKKNKIVIKTYKERNYTYRGETQQIGEIQFWNEADDVLETSISLSGGPISDATVRTQGKYLGSLKFHNKVTKEEAAEVAKILRDKFNEQTKTRVQFIPN